MSNGNAQKAIFLEYRLHNVQLPTTTIVRQIVLLPFDKSAKSGPFANVPQEITMGAE